MSLTPFYAIIHAATLAPGQSMAKKMQGLGNIMGRPLDEITAAIGPPNSVSATVTPDGGKTLRQWMASGYHVAMLFDADDKCMGITHEHLSR